MCTGTLLKPEWNKEYSQKKSLLTKPRRVRISRYLWSSNHLNYGPQGWMLVTDLLGKSEEWWQRCRRQKWDLGLLTYIRLDRWDGAGYISKMHPVISHQVSFLNPHHFNGCSIGFCFLFVWSTVLCHWNSQNLLLDRIVGANHDSCFSSFDTWIIKTSSKECAHLVVLSVYFAYEIKLAYHM